MGKVQVSAFGLLLYLWSILSLGQCFNFPGEADTGPGMDLTRQGNLTVLTPAPSVAPPIVTTTPTSCVCVPTGSCNFTTVPTDGSGQIDIRIVNTITTAATTVPPVTVPPPIQLVATAFQTSCAAGLVLCCYPGSYQCGFRYPPVAGSAAPVTGQASFGAYPWQAVLLGPNNAYAGSGALIDNLHILTVAHKVTPFTTGTALRVRLGEWDANGVQEPLPAQEQAVARIFVHPSYNANNLKNDIAILRLTTPVNLGQYPTVGTACLPTTSLVGMRCYVAGWGKNDFSNSGTYQNILKEVDVPVLDNPTCEARLRATRLGPTFIFDTGSFICAGGEAGKDACTGDGGSPLVCLVSGRWQIGGLVAWGIGCASAGVPGVYTNVANYSSWIQTTVRS